MSVLSVSIRFAPKYIITQALILGGVSVSQPITNPPTLVLNAIKGDTGPAGAAGAAGPQGPAGATGATGAAGTDATVTAPAIATALGFSPDNPATRTITPSQLTQASASTGNALVWNGSAWAPAAISASPGGSSGQFQYNNASAFAGVPGVSYASNTTTYLSQAAGAIPLAVQAASSQTGNLSEWRNSTGAMLRRVASDGADYMTNPNVTDPTNFERAGTRWVSNVYEFFSEKGGTGTARNVQFRVGGTGVFFLGATAITAQVGMGFGNNRSNSFMLANKTYTADGTETESGSVITNRGASAAVTRTLQTYTDNLHFKRVASFAFRVKPATGKAFTRQDGSTTTAGKYLELGSNGASVSIYYDGTSYLCFNETGTITMEP